MDSLSQAIQRYSELIDTLAVNPQGHLMIIGDPEMASARFYTQAELGNCFSYDDLTELLEEEVDDIEPMLLDHTSPYCLSQPLMTKLLQVSSVFNENGFTVLVGSWGMGTEEIAWRIRYANDEAHFLRYIREYGLSADCIDAIDSACRQEIDEAEQVSAGNPLDAQ